MKTDRKYNVVEEDEVVLYDETEDQFDDSIEYIGGNDATRGDNPENHDPNIVDGMYLGGLVKDKDGWRLKENEEVFTDEYMQKYDRYITEKAKREKRQNLWISIGVIAACIISIVGITALVFWLKN